MSKRRIHTDEAPAAIGAYSQAVEVGGTVYLSGQIPLVPGDMEIVAGGVREQIHQVFHNLGAVARAAGGDLADVVKLTVYLTDLGDFAAVNEIMSEHLGEPFPARAAVGVASLPRGAKVEIEGIMVPGAGR